jgi:putative Mg2+ transporter-C (MgtC) family protein
MDPVLPEWELALRLFLAIALCAAVGLERERLGQVAGMRTHLLVGAGAALFTAVSAYAFAPWIQQTPGASPTPVDPSRVAAQIVAGIGFLGAGAIITQGVTVRGLTTAATLWVSAAIGMACGIGYYFGAIFITVLVILALLGVRRMRHSIMTQIRNNIVFLEARVKSSKKLGNFLASLGQDGISLQKMDPLRKKKYRFELLVPAETSIDDLSRQIQKTPGVKIKAIRASRADAGDE